jgi:hypothetical protein
VNVDKSNILFSSNTTASTKASILDILPYAETPISAKHSGLPMFFGRSKQSSLFNILQKCNEKYKDRDLKPSPRQGNQFYLKWWLLLSIPML